MAALEHHFLLVGRADLRDQVLGRIIGNDVVVFGDRVQDRHLDIGDVSLAAAKDKYGVVLTGTLDEYDLAVDVAATNTLRKQMKAAVGAAS